MRRLSGRVFAATLAVTLGAMSATPRSANAYCRTSSCQEGAAHTAAVCDPPASDDCGTALAWSGPCAEFSVQEDGSPKLGITAADLTNVLISAFTTWQTAGCVGGGAPVMRVTKGPEASCDQHEYNQDAGNANIVLFHDASWPYEGSSNTLALTTVTYDVNSGQIYDADLEINSADNHFTTTDVGVDYDLQSVLTHETGHFQGLAHSHDPTATMWPSYTPGTTTLRTITADDVAAICAAYPPQATLPACDPTPRHGFSALCGAEQPVVATTSGCAVSRAGASNAEGRGVLAAVGLLVALNALGSRRRRAARARRPRV